MLLMALLKENGLKIPAYASLALAFASFGDAFLYAFLPVNNAGVGIPFVWVGILLSINRFVRIFSNGIMVYLFSIYSLRIIMIGAVILAISSTIGYGVASGISLWLVFRIFWGLSFSAMRLGTLGYALQNSKQGLALGVSKSFQEAGPMIALFFAPVLLHNIPIDNIFFWLAGFSLPALWFAWQLPKSRDQTPPIIHKRSLKFPSTLNSITFFAAMLIDGIMVVVLGILFLRYGDGISLITVTAMVAFYLGYRRICLVVLAPAGGWVSDKIGIHKVFNISVVFIILGLSILISGWVELGSVIVFTAYSIHTAVTPGIASLNQSHALRAVAANATWRDIGAALGTLIGGFLITSPYITPIFFIAIFGLVILLLMHLEKTRKAIRFLYAWK
jgi:MFS transporter, DHA1 family, multidrug resistance protein